MGEKIWAVMQVKDGGLHPMGRETIAAAQQVASKGETSVETSVEAIVLGSNLQAAVEELQGFDLSAVRPISSDSLGAYTPGAFIGALAAAIKEHGPDLVLFPHSYQSIDFVPRLAQAVDAVLITEVTGLRVDNGTRYWRRPVFAGKLQAEVKARREGLVFVTLQAGSHSADDIRPGSAPVEPIQLGEEPAPDREILGIEEVAGEHVDLSQADIIVAVGRGIGDPEKLPLVQELAAALGAELGASRPVIDNGWLERDRQIGSSGQTVSPKLYLAVGISGAIQHLVGMKGSQTVIAINKDRSAPIFGLASYGVVGDLFEIIPALTAAIVEAKGG